MTNNRDWFTVDCAFRLANWLVQKELVEPADEDDLALELVRFATRYGNLTNQDLRHARDTARCAYQKQIVRQYVRLVATTNNTAIKSEYLKEIGVTSHTIALWAKRHFGRCFLQGKGPTPMMNMAVHTLKQHDELNYKQVARLGGISIHSVTAVLKQAFDRNLVARRKGSDGVYLYRALAKAPG